MMDCGPIPALGKIGLFGLIRRDPGVPLPWDDVIIPANVEVWFDAQTPFLKTVSILADGSLRFDNGNGPSDTQLHVNL